MLAILLSIRLVQVYVLRPPALLLFFDFALFRFVLPLLFLSYLSILAGARLAEVDIAINTVLDRLDAVQVEHLIASALAHNQLLLSLDQFLAYLTDWRVDVILALIVHSKAQIPFAFGRSTVALSERCLKRVKLVVERQFFVFLNVTSSEYSN